MLAAVKKLLPSLGSPVAYMWWTQSPKARKPVATSESTIGMWPKTGRRAKVATIAETMPRAGTKMM